MDKVNKFKRNLKNRKIIIKAICKMERQKYKKQVCFSKIL